MWPDVWSGDCKFSKSMVWHDTECPYWDQVSLKNTNPTLHRSPSCTIPLRLMAGHSGQFAKHHDVMTYEWNATTMSVFIKREVQTRLDGPFCLLSPPTQTKPNQIGCRNWFAHSALFLQLPALTVHTFPEMLPMHTFAHVLSPNYSFIHLLS